MKYLLLPLFFLATFLSLQAQSISELRQLLKESKENNLDSAASVYAVQLADEYVILNKRNRRQGRASGLKFESVVYFYKEGIKYGELASDTALIGLAHTKLAKLYASRDSKKFVNDALSELQKAKVLYDLSKDTLAFAEVQYGASKLLMRTNQYPRATLALIEAIDYYEKAQDFDKAQDCARDLTDVYRRLGNTNKAEFYEEEAVRLSSSARELAQRDLLIQHKQDSLLMQKQDLALKEQEEARLKAEVDKQIAEKKQQRTFLVYTAVFAVFIAVVLFFALRARQQISSQKREVEKLLLNILPKKTAEELRVKGAATPQSYARVSVLFTDFKGFTQVSEKMTPEEIIEELGICFSAFDEIIEKNNLEKIKTIGDAYMCAGGVPEPNQSNPVDAARAALAMQEFIKGRVEENRLHGRPILELRIRIHTGPVVAGVVGKKKFAYDIWGDAVNIAARMESSGEPNKVNISGETFSLIKDQFECSYRGKIPAKNKGDIDMYFVEVEK